MTDEEQIDGVTYAEKDANGDIVVRPDMVSAGGVTSTGQIIGEESGDKAILSRGNGFVGMALESYRNSSSDHGILNFYSARGTKSSPGTIQNGDILTTLRPRGYTGGGFTSAGDFYAEATEDFSSTSNVGMRWVVEAVPAGTVDRRKVLFVEEQGIRIPLTGSASDPVIQIGANGAGFFVNSSGEVEVVDEAGNSTPIS